MNLYVRVENQNRYLVFDKLSLDVGIKDTNFIQR